MIQIFNQPLTNGTPVTVSVPYWGGVVEFQNYTVFMLDLLGGGGDMSLPSNNRVGLQNLANGTSYRVTPSLPASASNTQSSNLIVNYYQDGEMSSYPPTTLTDVIPASPQAGASASVFPVQDNSVASGGNLTIQNTPGKTLYFYGYDITGDKSAAVNTGQIQFIGLINPATGNFLNNLVWWINQTPNGVIFPTIRFPQSLQTPKATKNTVGFNTDADITIVRPAMSAGVFAVYYIANY